MPDTRGQSGIEHFEARAEALERRSSSGRFAAYEVQPGSGGDGHIVLETRGEPSADVPPADQEPEAAPKKGKKAKK